MISKVRTTLEYDVSEEQLSSFLATYRAEGYTEVHTTSTASSVAGRPIFRVTLGKDEKW